MLLQPVSLITKAKSFLLLIFFAVLCQPSFAQPDKAIDSLKNVLKTAAEDTNKVNTLNDLSYRLWKTSNNIESKKYGEEALALAQKLNFRMGIFTAYNNIGQSQANYTVSLKSHLSALKIILEIGNKKETAKTYNLIGQRYWRLGNYPEALKNYFISLNIREEMGDKIGIASSHNNIGIIYDLQGNYSEALKNYLYALKIAEEFNNKFGIATLKTNIGIIYTGQGNYPEALANHLAAQKIWEEMGAKSDIGESNGNIGEVYYFQGNYSKALKYHLAALKSAEEIGDTASIIYFTMFIGKVYTKLNKYSEAKLYLMNSLSLSKEIGTIINLKDAYNGLSELDSAMGNYQQAFMHLKLYNIFKDSLLNEVNSKQTVQMKEQYESEKKDKEILQQSKEKIIQSLEIKKQKQAKNYFIAGFALFAILSFFVYRNYRTRQKLKLQTLRNKIARDLHDDVGSTLSSISIFSQMAQEQSKETIPLLETIGESSRKMLDAMADIVWTINPENDQFEKIILRMRSFAYELLGAKQIDFEFVADEDVAKMKLPMEVRKNLYLIFKEATNNLVKYSGANRAFFTVKKEVNNLTMLIRDNGKGFDTGNVKEGNGLINMKKRAGEIGALFSIDSLPGNGTTIQLKVAV